MKKLPLILASASLFVASIAPAFAVDEVMTTEAVAPTTTTTRTTTSLKQVVRPTLQTMKAEAVDAKQAMMSKAKEAFRAKLAEIKDEKKRLTVENLDTRIATVNENRTTQMADNLTKLSEILDRIAAKATAAKTAGQDAKTIDSDLTAARTALTSAQTAVTAQAAKTYTITITKETALKTNVMTTLALFRKDIQAVHKKVLTAREGARVAAIDLEKLKKSAVTLTPSPTASEAANQ